MQKLARRLIPAFSSSSVRKRCYLVTRACLGFLAPNTPSVTQLVCCLAPQSALLSMEVWNFLRKMPTTINKYAKEYTFPGQLCRPELKDWHRRSYAGKE
jgi:hypothetical protein